MKGPTLNSNCIKTKVTKGWLFVSLLLFSLFLEGVALPIAGRTPMLSPFYVLVALMTLLMLVQNLVGDIYWEFPDKTLFVLAAAYLFAQIWSLFFNYRDILRSTLFIAISILGLLVYWITTTRVRTRHDIEKTITSVILWGALLGGILLYHFLTDWTSMISAQASYEAKDEIGITIGRSNYLAAMLVPILPVAVACIFAKRGMQRLISIVASFSIVSGLLITMSKGALLALIFGLIVALPFIKKARIKLHYLLLFFVLGVASLWFTSRDLVETNYAMIVYRLDNPDLERPALWKVAWDEFLENPIVGIGPDCIYIYNRQYAIDVLHTHDFVLNILAELGLFGAIPFFGILFVIIRRSYKLCLTSCTDLKSRYVPIGLFVGLISTLAHGLVEPTFHGPQYAIIFWVFSALIFLYDSNQQFFLNSKIV